MPSDAALQPSSPIAVERPSPVPLRAVVIMVAGMTAAWIAAGSVGLLADGLRHALVWLALGVAVVAAWPRREGPVGDWLSLGVGVLAGLVMTSFSDPALGVLAVAVVLAVLVRSPHLLRGRLILLTTLAVAVFGVYRAAYEATANGLGSVLGSLGAGAADRELHVGATFGGVGFLVLMAAFYAGWLVWTRTPRWPRAISAGAAILLGHIVYLVVLSFAGEMLAALPELRPPEVPEQGTNHVGVFSWSVAVGTLLPWCLPALGAAIHAAIAVVMVRWAIWAPIPEPEPAQKKRKEDLAGRELAADMLLTFGPAVLAVAFSVAAVLSTARSDLSGTRVVFYEQGQLDWEKPEYGSSEGGMYGMLPVLVESLGGTVVHSQELTAADLGDQEPTPGPNSTSTVLVLLHPDRPWPEERLERLGQWVRDGGALLVGAGPRMADGTRRSSFDQVLRPPGVEAGIEVRHDTAISAVPHWEGTVGALNHPTTTGIDDGRNRLGLFYGSSLATRWPAQPLATGRFAFSEPGSRATRTGQFRYDAGELLGDLTLAAEQRVGRGLVAVLGDSTCLHNEMIVRAYPFAGRLLARLAQRSAGPRAWWRQILGLLAAAGLVGLLAWRPNAPRIAIGAVVLAVALYCCVAASHHAGRVLPEGPADSPHPVAYIDTTHVEAYSSDSWGDLGLNGLERTLMRAGYLPLYLPELSGERLERAAMLISIAPARDFSSDERQTVDRFVQSGGLLVCTAGAEHAGATNELIEQFGFHVPPSPVPPSELAREPRPEGVLYSRYLVIEDYEPAMWHHAAWPVEDADGRAGVLKRDMADEPTIVMRSVGKGAVLVIGDTYFATNENLEWGPVQPTMENVVFWRWMLSRVIGPEWLPPKPEADTSTPEEPPAEETPAKPPPDEEASPPEEEVPPEEKPREETPGGPGALPIGEMPGPVPPEKPDSSRLAPRDGAASRGARWLLAGEAP